MECPALVRHFICCINIIYFNNKKYLNILKDIDECENATICGMGGTCNNTVGNYTCECQTGYTLSGRMCQGNI